MKKIEDLYKEILADEGLKTKLAEAVKGGTLEDFLKANDCDATVSDVKGFLDAKKEIGVEELENTAGGGCGKDVALSISTLGIGCAAIAAVSATTDGGSSDSALCDKFN